jgi:diacylglycerol kinase family enzyme
MPHRIFIVFNPGSGHQGDRGLPDRLRALAAREGEAVTLHEMRKGEDLHALCRRALAEGHDCIAVAGGDGTVAGVADAMRGLDVPLGVLPMGTFNYFARGIGVPLDLDSAFAALRGGVACPVATGTVNGKVFLNNASLGVYPAILRKREGIYRRWGRSRMMAYVSVISTILGFSRGRRMRVTVDGVARRQRAPLLFVANSAYQLEEFGLPGADAIRDGQFAVFLSKDVGRWGLLRHAALLMGRSMRNHRDFELMIGREVQVAGPRRPLVAIDGERRILDAPVRITRDDSLLHVILPRKEKAEAA